MRHKLMSRHCLLLASCLTLSGTFAHADTNMTATAFDAFSAGKILHYTTNGKDYGAEQYLPDRTVIWFTPEDGCIKGKWFEQDQRICFVYEDKPDLSCWQFQQTENGLRGTLDGDPADAPETMLTPSDAALICD
ncbi:MAG: hypothetical protein WCC57_17325 [Paracoccaceae bacterium]